MSQLELNERSLLYKHYMRSTRVVLFVSLFYFAVLCVLVKRSGSQDGCYRPDKRLQTLQLQNVQQSDAIAALEERLVNIEIRQTGSVGSDSVALTLLVEPFVHTIDISNGCVSFNETLQSRGRHLINFLLSNPIRIPDRDCQNVIQKKRLPTCGVQR